MYPIMYLARNRNVFVSIFSCHRMLSALVMKLGAMYVVFSNMFLIIPNLCNLFCVILCKLVLYVHMALVHLWVSKSIWSFVDFFVM